MLFKTESNFLELGMGGGFRVSMLNINAAHGVEELTLVSQVGGFSSVLIVSQNT